MRKLILKIKRFLFKKITGLNPEDIQRLVYVQKYLEKRHPKYKSYNEYLREHFNKLNEVQNADISR